MGAPDDIKNSATWKKVLLIRNLHLNGHIVIFHEMRRFKLGLILYCNLFTANSTNHIKPANRCRDFHLNSVNSLRL